jgi:predicted amidohydrolase
MLGMPFSQVIVSATVNAAHVFRLRCVAAAMRRGGDTAGPDMAILLIEHGYEL